MKFKIKYWIKSPCGRRKYEELNLKKSFLARVRLYWFVLIASLRDLNLELEDQAEGSEL